MGCRRKPLTGMSIGVSAPAIRTSLAVERDFLMRLSQRSVRVRLARLDHAARQRNLPAVTTERVRPHRQHDVRVTLERKHQEQAGGVPDLRGLQPSGH